MDAVRLARHGHKMLPDQVALDLCVNRQIPQHCEYDIARRVMT